MTAPTDAELAAWDALAATATPGPWTVDAGMNHTTDGDSTFQHILAIGADNPACGAGIADTYHSPSITVTWCGSVETVPARHGNADNAAFIAAAREGWPATIAALRAARQADADLRANCAGLSAQIATWQASNATLRAQLAAAEANLLEPREADMILRGDYDGANILIAKLERIAPKVSEPSAERAG